MNFDLLFIFNDFFVCTCIIQFEVCDRIVFVNRSSAGINDNNLSKAVGYIIFVVGRHAFKSFSLFLTQNEVENLFYEAWSSDNDFVSANTFILCGVQTKTADIQHWSD